MAGCPTTPQLASLDLSEAYSELQRLLLQTPDMEDFLGHVAAVASAVTLVSSSMGITLKM